jgi:hypothetical protein
VGGRGAERERRAGPRQCQRVAVGHAMGVAGGGERHCKRVLRARGKSSCRVAAQQDNEENAPNVHEGCSITLSCAQRVPHFFTRCAPPSQSLALAHCAMHMHVHVYSAASLLASQVHRRQRRRERACSVDRGLYGSRHTVSATPESHVNINHEYYIYIYTYCKAVCVLLLSRKGILGMADRACAAHPPLACKTPPPHAHLSRSSRSNAAAGSRTARQAVQHTRRTPRSARHQHWRRLHDMAHG